MVIGILFLLVSIGASAMLVLEHLGGIALPGCGVGSPCAALTEGPWGKVPGLGWPISSIGLAYFVALLVGWIAARGSGGGHAPPEAGFKWLVRFGALLSLAFIALMVWKRTACLYCIAAHAGNLAFWITVERAAVQFTRRHIFSWTVVVFSSCLALLLTLETSQKRRTAEREEAAHGESVQKMLEQGTQAAQTQPQSDAQFTGRYRTGPADAPIRVVIISDYQCQHCRGVDGQARRLAGRSDVSISAKHFPFCKDCNRHVGNANPHPNACWAARAAEAAGILRGNDGFWQMHHWLFERGGGFTDAELNAALTQFGYDVAEFNRVMQGPETLARVQQDIEEAIALGLHLTPMVFINGIELRGAVSIPDALVSAVETLARGAASPADAAAADRPAAALDKYIEDWRQQPAKMIPSGTRSSVQHPAGSAVRITVWSDYQFPLTAELDAAIRAAIKDRPDASYVFRYYPFDQTCNPHVSRTQFAAGCLAARASAAAETVGGAPARQRMHQWLLANRTQVSEAALPTAAAELGLDAAGAGRFSAAMQAPQVAAAIAEDVEAGHTMFQSIPKFYTTGIPLVYINEKWVPRWRLEGQDVVGRIVAEAGK